VTQFPSLDYCCEALDASCTAAPGASKQDSSWVVPFRASGTRPPLFFACAGGGDALDYRDLAAALPEDQPVYSFGLPREPVPGQFPTVESIAATYVKKIREIQKRGPYYLCGHSFGGLAVYHMAVLLAEQGEETGLLALLDTEHPAYTSILPLRKRAAFHLTYVGDRIAKYSRNLRQGRIDRIAEDAYALFIGKYRRLAWALGRRLFPALGREMPSQIRTNTLVLKSAWSTYNPPEFAGRAVLFNVYGRTPEYKVDPLLGWQKCVAGTIDLKMVQGDHYSLLHPPHVHDLVRNMLPYLGSPECAFPVGGSLACRSTSPS